MGTGKIITIVLCITTLFIIGCDSTNMSADNLKSNYRNASENDRLQKSENTGGISAQVQYLVDLEVQGLLKPKERINIKTNILNQLTPTETSVNLLLPELVAMQNESFRNGVAEYYLPMNTKLKSEFSESLNLAENERWTKETQIVFKEPGYYHVYATAKNSKSKLITEDGKWLNGTTTKDLWLWIDEKGGKVTQTFDSTLFADEYRKLPGPLTLKNETHKIKRGFSKTTSETRAAKSAGGTTISVFYENPSTSSVHPLSNARMQYEILDARSHVMSSSTVYLNNQGQAEIACYIDFRGPGSYKATIHTQDNHRLGVFNIFGSDVAASFSGDFSSDCGETVSYPADSFRAHVFSVLNETIDNSNQIFQKQRGKVQVNISPNINRSYYNRSSDQIFIRNNNEESHIGGTFGDFVVAHEYGHAFHEKALGGNEGGGCPSSHYLDGAYNRGCAYSEGFADYYSIVTYAGFYQHLFESNSYYPANYGSGDRDDGSIIEGAVAAFLFDLTDPDNETQDQVHYPGSYLADIISDCKVNYGSSYERANGIDHAIACLENRIPDYSGDYFSTSSPPSLYSEQVSEPNDWNADKIEQVWKYNLYGENSEGPSPYAVLGGSSTIGEGDQAYYSGMLYNGSDGTYTFRWYINSSLKQTNQHGNWADNFTWTSYGSTGYTVKLEITDGSETYSDEMTVEVIECPEGDPYGGVGAPCR